MDKVRAKMQLSDAMLAVGQNTKKSLDPKSPQWSVVYTLHYDALHELADALVSFHNKKIPNHQCLFAFLCTHHQDLELNWDFFERVRAKRNGIQYYGTPTTYKDWKEIELQINIYITTLKKTVEQKLK